MSIIKRNLYKCDWKIGDVFAYKLESELASEKGLLGRYFLIQKVDEGYWHPGHTIPIVRIKITSDDKLPENVEQFNELEYVQVSFTEYEDRFMPYNFSRFDEDIAEKSKLKYETDEYGYLPEFRVKMICTSKRSIPKKLTYIGNFEGALPPRIEFVPHVEVNIMSLMWDEFEKRVIKLFFYHNHRQLKIYQR